jgi:hypothetical protein
LPEKTESTEQIAQFLVGRAGTEPLHMQQRTGAIVQLLALVLGEIADHQVRIDRTRALGERQQPREHGQQGRLARTIRPQDPDPVVRPQAQRGRVQPDAAVHGDARAVQAQQRVRQPGGGRDLQVHRPRRAQQCHLVQPLQPLQPALGLPRLACLGPEARDEALQVRAFLGHTGGRGLGLGDDLGAAPLGRAVVAGEQLYLPVLDMGDMRDHRIQEATVMRDHDQGARIAAQPVLQPEDGLEIEMVGRLVQQQQVGSGHQGLGQAQAHAPATGEFGDGTFRILRREAETGQELPRPGLGAPAVDRVDLGVEMAVFLAVLAVCQACLQCPQGGIAIQHIVDRPPGAGIHLLRQVGADPTAWPIDLAGVGRQLAAQCSQQRTLAAAVRAGQAHAPARMNPKGCMADQRLATAAQFHVLETNHGRKCSACSPPGPTEPHGKPTAMGHQPYRASSQERPLVAIPTHGAKPIATGGRSDNTTPSAAMECGSLLPLSPREAGQKSCQT